MDDLGVVYTDKKIETLEKKINQAYKTAQRDIQKKLDTFLEKSAAKEKVYLSRVASGKMTQEDFDHWKKNQVFYGNAWKTQSKNIANVLANTNKTATAWINGEKADVFAFNGNYSAYDFEHGFGVNFGFDLYSESSVKHLLKDNPKILPKSSLDITKDVNWNMRNIRSQITQGILQGESIPKIADRLATLVPERNRDQMILHARTAMTSAQNAGRQERYKEAEALGIKFKKVWLATLDSRTRETHQDADGQAVEPKEAFRVGGYSLEYPGDPSAPPEETYNCRCTMVTELDDYPSSFDRRAYDESGDRRKSYITEDTTYNEWVKTKRSVQDSKPVTANIPKSYAEELVDKKYSPHISQFTDVHDYWDAKKEWGSEQTRYIDDIYEYGKFTTHTGWGGKREGDKIPRIEATVADLNDKYPALSSGEQEYGVKLQNLTVCDYNRAWEFLPDGQNDRRLNSDASAQVFIVPNKNGQGNDSVVIAFNRGTLTETVEESIKNRERAIESGEILSSIGFSPEVTTIHEWGHVMSNHLDNAMVYQDETVVEYWNWYKGLSKDEIRKGISDYATANRGEFEAECFAELQMPNPRPIAVKFGEYLDAVIGKGY